MKKIFTLLVLALSSYAGLLCAHGQEKAGTYIQKFKDPKLNQTYGNVVEDLSVPLFNIQEIENDIHAVEKILKDSKVTQFRINNEWDSKGFRLKWDHLGLQFQAKGIYENWIHIDCGTEEVKYLCHKELSLLLETAQKELKKMRK